ncbi:LysR family transcriptional regulator [Xanthomonas hyacinthi]|uniref:LysR family transcriptional regulator n=1 Tax=Xanthomonas hyacinthi TaxID=56455 RepID=UPI001AD69B02|nr:LysR family transcriptional regulator [Xanthomonas hyacinthi]
MSFTRAAQELHLTQSAVSKQVAQLEEMLRHALFHRLRRRLKLTAAGELYLTEVNRILCQVDMSSRYILSYGGETQVLKVAAQPTFGARWLIPCLKGFSRRHPTLHLDLRSELEPFDLLQAKADVAFFYGRGSWPGATCIELFGEEMVPVCTPDILPARRLSSAAELADLVLLQCASRPEAWHEWFAAQSLDTANSYHGPRFDTFHMCIRAAQAGCGVALVPRLLVEEELADGKLAIPWHYRMPSDGAYFLAYAEHAIDIPRVRSLVEWVLEKAAATRAADPERQE